MGDSLSYLDNLLYQPIFCSIAAILRDSTIVVVHTHPPAIPLPMISMRKSTFPFVSYMGMGLHLLGLWTAGAPL